MMRSQPLRDRLFASILIIALAASAQAGPWVAPGDMALRHDIQVLAAAGVLTGPVTSWPLSWGDILNDIAQFNDNASLSQTEAQTLVRVRRLGVRNTRIGELNNSLDANYDTEPSRLRGFERRAREDTDLSVGASWLGKTLAAEIRGNGVSSPDDDQSVRLDGSYVGVALGNYMISAGQMDRWW